MSYDTSSSLSDDDQSEVHIALVLVLPRDQEAALKAPKSPLLINPGGPGGSGVGLAISSGAILQEIIGHDRPVIGFDPRGIGFTTPSADCWAGPPACGGCPEDRKSGMMHRLESMNEARGFGFVNSSNIAAKLIDARERSLNTLCRTKNNQLGGESILRHAATTHVATDMLTIVDAWERWVDKETAAAGVTVTEPNPTKGKLVYWGFSYGTYLGATFASMFPDRVGRVALDGVVDAEYYVSDIWKESLVDADKILSLFFEECFTAGPNCALWRASDKEGAADIRRRFHRILKELEEHPVTFTHPQFFYPVMLKSEDIRALVFASLYRPSYLVPMVAPLLNHVYEGEFEQLSMLFGDLQVVCKLPTSVVNMGLSDAQRAIMGQRSVR